MKLVYPFGIWYSWLIYSFSGLSGTDLMMADLEALKLYINYLRHASQVWFMPLPEVYDHERVAYYFSCRPHVLVFRMVEVFEIIPLYYLLAMLFEYVDRTL